MRGKAAILVFMLALLSLPVFFADATIQPQNQPGPGGPGSGGSCTYAAP